MFTAPTGTTLDKPSANMLSQDLNFVSAVSLPRTYQKELIQNMEKSISTEMYLKAFLIIMKY